MQIALELAGCLLLADFARRIAPPALKPGAAHATLWLAALCPFTAVYAATRSPKGPRCFALRWPCGRRRGFRNGRAGAPRSGFTFAVTFAALLRPDGALAAVALAPACSCWPRERGRWHASARRQASAMALVCALLALDAFRRWTGRNWQVFHVFQPLAPALGHRSRRPGDSRLGSLGEDLVPRFRLHLPGRTGTSPDDALDISKLPGRAFDSPAQHAETAALAADYNNNGFNLTPADRCGFARLAAERIAAHPLRYYLWLPLGRVADMWLSPRVENLPIDLDWWVYAHHHAETRFSWAMRG